MDLILLFGMMFGLKTLILKAFFSRLYAMKLNKKGLVHDKVNEGLTHSFRRLPR